MTASASDASGDTADRPPVAPVASARLNRLGPVGGAAPEAGAPVLRDFLGDADNRLRDLVAFGLATEAGRVPAPDGIEGLRRKAEAELNAHAFRLLHNQVEEIRRQAVMDHVARLPRPLGFWRTTLAGLLALLLAGLLAAVLLALDPAILARLTDPVTRLLAPLAGGA